jgi:hypothetical protein
LRPMSWSTVVASAFSMIGAPRVLTGQSEAAGEKLDLIMIPKVLDADDVLFVDKLLTQLEKDLGIKSRIGLECLASCPGLVPTTSVLAPGDSEPSYSRGFKSGLFNLPAPGSPSVAPAVSDIVATFTHFPRFV